MSHQFNGTGRIVVGVDGSPSSIEALRWALRQADATGWAVEAVHAWQVPSAYGAAAVMLPSEDFAIEAKSTLESAIARTADGDVPVDRRVIEGHPAKALLERAKGADLLVVGSRGRGGFIGALLGSVSQHCVQHAACPVVVVRGR